MNSTPTFVFDDLSPVCKDAMKVLFDEKQAGMYTFLRTNAVGQKSMYARVYIGLRGTTIQVTPCIVKCIKLDESSFTLIDLKDEVKMHRRYASIGLAPVLHVAFVCVSDASPNQKVGYLVMDMKVKELFMYHLSKISLLFLHVLRDEILSIVRIANKRG